MRKMIKRKKQYRMGKRTDSFGGKFYKGPGGLFYNASYDYLFTLEPTGLALYDLKKKKIVGQQYDYEDARRQMLGVTITSGKDLKVFRLGEYQ